MADLRAPPRISGSRLALTREFMRDPLAFACRIAVDYPEVVEVPLLGVTYHIVSDPLLIEELLIKRSQDVTKDRFTWRLREFLGHGLLTADGDHWKRQRRLIQPAFHRRRVAGYADVMVAEGEAMLAGWGGDEVRDVHHDLMALTLAIAGRTFFGSDVGGGAAAVGEALELMMARYSGELWSWFVPLWLPTRRNRRTRAAVRRVDALLESIIDARRRSGEESGDLLSLLLHAQDEDGARMTNRQLRDECITLFLAGHETTALTLTYALFLLAQDPAVADRLAAEVEALAPGRALTIDDLPGLRACDQVVKESMRLYPPAWSIGREALRPIELGGALLPAGTQVAIFTWAVHRSPKTFPEPLEFRPGRWTAEFERGLPRQAYMPFGGGQRVCIGNTFAMVEATLLLATLLRRFSFELAGPPALRLTPSITMRPQGGVHLRLRARAAAAPTTA